jgi:hypothetical protein
MVLNYPVILQTEKSDNIFFKTLLRIRKGIFLHNLPVLVEVLTIAGIDREINIFCKQHLGMKHLKVANSQNNDIVHLSVSC